MGGIHIIVACDKNGGIARNGVIPWKFNSDLKHFKNTTLGHILLMGRKTWESLPVKPLPDRYHIVLSHSQQMFESSDKIIQMENMEDAMYWFCCNSDKDKKLFVIGGAQIYTEILDTWIDLVQSIYVTQIEEDYQCDQWFCYNDDLMEKHGFELTSFESVVEKDTTLSFLRFERKSRVLRKVI